MRSARVVLALAVVAVPAMALAQAPGEWSTFQPPPPPTVPDKTAAKPETPAAKPETPPATSPTTKPAIEPATTPMTTLPGAGAAAVAGADNTVTKESVLPGTEPPATGTAKNGVLDSANLRTTSGSWGQTGLLHVSSADVGRPMVLRLSILGEYFTKSDFPVLGAHNTRTAGTFAADFTFHKYGEAYLSYAASANTNSRASPPLMQAQGDVSIGLKGGYPVAKGFTAGADLRFILFPGVGAQDIRRYAVGFAPKAAATYDFRTLTPKAPFRAHLNAGIILDGTGTLVSKELTPSEEYALGVNKYNRFTLGFGVESPLPWATPFVEYGFALPLAAKNLVGPDLKPVTAASAMPHILSIGGKVTALRDVTFLLAVDLGLARYVARGIPATQPFNFVFGISYAIDPTAKGESRMVERTTTVEKKVEVATAAPVYTGKVSGAVLDSATRQPVPGVVIAMAGTGLPPVASDAEGGRFLTHELPAGKVSLTFSRDGYLPAALEAAVEAGKVAAVEALLTREIKNGTVKMTLVAGKQKVAGKVTFAGPKAAELVAAKGDNSIDLPKGHYAATVDAEGFLSRVKELDVPEGGEVHVDIELAPMPKQTLVVVKDDRIQIKQQVHFATGKAAILADSNQLLDQVIDAMLRAGIKKLRIEGHTDNQGGKAFNMKLSQDRADAVKEYLVKKGIDTGKLLSEGFGDTKPAAPNLTARGRELNRRVEFMIVEK